MPLNDLPLQANEVGLNLSHAGFSFATIGTFTTDGPFAETKEQFGGFILIDAKKPPALPGRGPFVGRTGDVVSLVDATIRRRVIAGSAQVITS